MESPGCLQLEPGPCEPQRGWDSILKVWSWLFREELEGTEWSQRTHTHSLLKPAFPMDWGKSYGAVEAEGAGA